MRAAAVALGVILSISCSSCSSSSSSSSSSSAVAAALPSRRSTSGCGDYIGGLTAWSDANFTGRSYQYNVSANTCISMAGQFPYERPAGVSSVAANPFNWCTLYPNTDCDPGLGRANDTLDVVGSYYDLAGSEEVWDNLAQSFSCRPYDC